ncbi:hypothetical protein C8R44DRAFT_887975 [Mycena epipterygia]|nr:hypothetical protein C8R44DRAFT_887975 [Mycena epipterygia]
MAPLIAQLRLKHLHGYVAPLLRTLPPIHPCFSQITHLEMMDSRHALESWSALALIPQLTHLAVNDDAFVPLCGELLETCASLAVLVFIMRSEMGPLYEAGCSTDFRFVAIRSSLGARSSHVLQDWQMGACTGMDYWSGAESFIAKRRSGEVDALQYHIPDDPI